MPDRYDRLVVKTKGTSLQWRYLSTSARFVETALAALMLVLLGVTWWGPWRHPVYITYLVPVIVIATSNLSKRSRPQLLVTPESCRAALAELNASGREKRPGTWIVDGPEAAVLARRFGRWALSGLTPEELVAREPDDVAIESYQPGEQWPAAPRGDREGWPRLEGRG